MSEEAPAQPIGRYLLFGEIASGGMASVHLGRLSGPAGFSRTVAIKRLHAQYAKDPDFVAMFLDEARLAARVRHPNVVPTLDIVETQGEIFLVMEYVQGASLARLLRAAKTAQTPADPWMVATLVSGVLHGLHAAHEARGERGEALEIVHRDVSPQNVLVGVDGVPRVLDFGVAKAVGRLQTTREGQVKGKFAYMAPEQLYGRGVTRQADVYAASVVAWEALTGERLFKADSEGAIVHAVLHDRVKPPSEIIRTLPVELDDVVMRGLERDPGRRFATARDMALELERLGGIAPASEIGRWVDGLVHGELAERAARIAEIEDASSPALPTLSLPAAPGGTETEMRSDVSSIAVAPILSHPPRPQRNRLAVVIATAALVTLLLLIGVISWTRDDRGSAYQGATAASPAAPSASASTAPSATTPIIDATNLPRAAPPALPVTALPTAPRREPPPLPAAGPAARPAPASSVNCDPPYWIDGDGHTRYKPACL